MTSLRKMPQRRSKANILKALKAFIEKKQMEGDDEFFKSDVVSSEAKIHPDTAEDFFRIIEKAQKEFPLIEVREVGGMTLIRILNESRTLIDAIDKLVADGNFSKDTVGELLTFRTKLITDTGEGKSNYGRSK